MNQTSETPAAGGRSLGRTVIAVLILAVAAWILLHFVIHVVVFLASILVVVFAIVAVVWALRILL
jgi:uncharacterized membrane protein